MDYTEEFDTFRKAYPGVKRGCDTELNDFRKKWKDWKQVIPLLLPALKQQIRRRRIDARANRFVPPWKHLKTYLHNRCWEETVGVEESSEEKVKKAQQEREKEKAKAREDYQRYFESKTTQALKDLKNDKGSFVFCYGWLIDEILQKRRNKQKDELGVR